MAAWTPLVTHGGQDLSASPEPLLNIGVSWQGLIKLGAFDRLGGNAAAEEEFFWDFRKPPHAESLRAFGASAPTNWWNRKFGSDDIDLIVQVYTITEAFLETITNALRKSARINEVRELIPTRDGEAITGRAIAGRKLHFGYQDGISHPSVNWDDQPNRADLYHRGHFILGDWLENAQAFPKNPPFSDFTRDGSYIAFVWIYQDVAQFSRFLRDKGPLTAPHLSQSESEEWLAAKLMGRWRDGTPLVLSPDKPDAALIMANNFGYAEDPEGKRCPFAAHIRVTNGRDQPLDFANARMFPAGFPRVLRRGTPYGPSLEGDEDDGRDRGLGGIFLCANLNRQFYSLTRWIGRTDFSPVYRDTRGQDPLMGNRSVPSASDVFTIPTVRGSVIIKGLVDFIRLQGVVMMLLPSLSTLRTLSVV